MEKFVLFTLGERWFALPGDRVQEIVLDHQIYSLPFVPPWVRGLINRHGEPCTVLDLQALLFQEELKARRFLVIRTEGDRYCFLISEVLSIVTLSEEDCHKLTAEAANEGYFSAMLTWNGRDIPVVDCEKISTRQEKDLAQQ